MGSVSVVFVFLGPCPALPDSATWVPGRKVEILTPRMANRATF
jgi:hypothetical protein